jgi:hypothetical protein
VYSIVHDENGGRRWPRDGFELTGSDGTALIPFDVSGVASDEVVTVDVYFIHEGETFHAATSFAPRC